MKNSEKKLGVSLLVLGMLMSGEAAAQTCVIPPTCEELGYDKVASDCGSLAKLKCPFDDSKYFCTAYTDSNGAKIAEIGDIVYKDTISAEPIPGRIPVGIVYDLSGKMMSLSRFSGSLASPCSSYAPDGVGSWSLPTLQDMSLIKTNVTKINSQLAKIADTYQIETDKTSSISNNSRTWKTTGKYGACMMDNVAITKETDHGCYNLSYPENALCIRTFSSGGAGKDPTPTTYAVGDTYIDKDGIALGTVAKVDSTGKHGTILTIGGIASTNLNASTACQNKTTGGLSWSLATGRETCIVGEHSCCAAKYLSSDGTGYCDDSYDGSWCLTGSSGSFIFYCRALF